LNLEAIKYLVIDEADELLKRGFIDEVEAIISRVPYDRTTLLFSATMPEAITSICNKYMENSTRIEVESDQEPIDQIKQSWYEVSDDWKFHLMIRLLDQQKPSSCIVFCKTRIKVDQLSDRLNKARYKCASLHGDMAQKYRLRSISEFKDGRVPILVATDLAARGIHVDKLDLVINYNVPQEDDSYVHRIGRTGRVGEKGEAITLVSEHDRKRWEEIQAFIGYQVPKGPDNMLSESSSTSRSHSKKGPKMDESGMLVDEGRHNQNTTNKSSAKVISGKDAKRDGRADKDRRRVKDERSRNVSRPNRQGATKQHRDIMRIRINAGKKKKVRAGDILGAVSNLPGITSEDIGIIDIQDGCSYIEVFNNKGQLVYDALPNTKVKGKDVTVKKVVTK
jgi:ATP-dependent RNA helicase DeaD